METAARKSSVPTRTVDVLIDLRYSCIPLSDHGRVLETLLALV